MAARAGSKLALEALAGPERPEALDYLWDWTRQLVGRSGAGMDGPAPLSYTTIAEWARLYRIDIAPDEVEALMILDVVMRHPGEEKPEDAD